MKAGLLQAYHPTTLGLGPPLLLVVMPAFALVVLQTFVLLNLRIGDPPPANWRHVVLNFYLVGALGAAYLAWCVMHFRGWVSIATGAGFLVAGYALLQRIFCEFLASFFTVPLHLVDEVPYSVEAGAAAWMGLARGSGLVGFVLGLAFVVAACLAERRLRREAPAWAFPE